MSSSRIQYNNLHFVVTGKQLIHVHNEYLEYFVLNQVPGVEKKKYMSFHVSKISKDGAGNKYIESFTTGTVRHWVGESAVSGRNLQRE